MPYPVDVTTRYKKAPHPWLLRNAGRHELQICMAIQRTCQAKVCRARHVFTRAQLYNQPKQPD